MKTNNDLHVVKETKVVITIRIKGLQKLGQTQQTTL
jgi:hypothetical protein